MPLSEAFVDAHIRDWRNRLAGISYAHRKKWPGRLFHHAPIENALAILDDGFLRSRNDPERRRLQDVAAPGVIDSRQDAHDRVRLYFRPRTPTQYHIEGIRKDGECRFGESTHAPVLVMFVLDAKEVLTQPDIMFSNMNMQKSDAIIGSDEDQFSDIPFEKVFSEGGMGGDRSIIAARCAEVLPSSPLPLDRCLKRLYFRSKPERDTLLYLLGDKRNLWSKYCSVSDALKSFQKDFTFVEKLQLTDEGVVFRLNPRKDGKSISVNISVVGSSGRPVADFSSPSLPPRPASPALDWIFRKKLGAGDYLLKVTLDGHLAYQAELAVGDTFF